MHVKDVFGDEAQEQPQGRPWVQVAAITGLVLGIAFSALLFFASSSTPPWILLSVVLFPLWFATPVWLAELADRLAPPSVRALVQSIVVALFFAPGLVVGHGAAPAPAVLVLFAPGHTAFGAVCLILTALVALPFFYVRAVRAPR